MPAAAAERMSRVDTAWLRMDNEVNLMMIVGVWLLQPALDYDELCVRVAAKLLRYDRFRQKVVQDAMGAVWVDDAEFDIHHHVVRERLARRTGQNEREAPGELFHGETPEVGAGPVSVTAALAVDRPQCGLGQSATMQRKPSPPGAGNPIVQTSCLIVQDRWEST